MKSRDDVLQPVDAAARRSAVSLVRAARHAALATLLPESGAPLASRVLVATDEAGCPLLLVSLLSAHAGALLADARCSLLFGEVGAGDPLAQPRISLFGMAKPLEGEERTAARSRFLARHPAAALYCDFADFRLFRVEPQGANLNGGFAKAYVLGADDLLDARDVALQARLQRAVEHMNEDHADAVDAIVATKAGGTGIGWRIVTADPTGFEVARGDEMRRVFFETAIETAEAIRPAFVALAQASA